MNRSSMGLKVRPVRVFHKNLIGRVDCKTIVYKSVYNYLMQRYDEALLSAILKNE